MINYTIGNQFSKDDLLKKLIKNINNNKHILRENTNIVSVYGSFTGAIFNGGRIMGREKVPIEHIEEEFKFYASVGISVNLTFSNSYIESKHLKDEYCNSILKIASGYKNNGVIMNNDVLLKYIKTNYKNLKTIHSCTSHTLDKTKYKDLLDKYDRVVITPELNSDIDFLSSVSNEDVEIVANEDCVAYCKDRLNCYQSISKFLLKGTKDGFVCKFKKAGNSGKMELDIKKITEISNLGISNFKLSGRTDIGYIDEVLTYIIKDIHLGDIRQHLGLMPQPSNPVDNFF